MKPMRYQPSMNWEGQWTSEVQLLVPQFQKDPWDGTLRRALTDALMESGAPSCVSALRFVAFLRWEFRRGLQHRKAFQLVNCTSAFGMALRHRIRHGLHGNAPGPIPIDVDISRLKPTLWNIEERYLQYQKSPGHYVYGDQEVLTDVEWVVNQVRLTVGCLWILRLTSTKTRRI